jgi:ATP-dependent Lhr-like helicase
MRALAADTAAALAEPLPALAPNWTIGVRSGGTPQAVRAAQDRRLPSVLVTTPESLSLLLARADAAGRMAHVRAVVVDEWHELMGNKRGTQTQLALARLRQWQPKLVVWGLSATLGNQQEALDALLSEGQSGIVVRGKTTKRLTIDTLLPPAGPRFPWAGHLGMSMLPAVAAEIAGHRNTLIFVNTRSQAELWYQALLEAHPDWAGALALHHGSLDPATRAWVEQQLKLGRLRAVVCTSSLDLGVDFHPVERVLQIGSAKGIARLLQRAGRSGHAPGRVSRITLVPTHLLEVIEGAAARAAATAGQIEHRPVPLKPLDVLVQHLVTVALGGGFTPEALVAEVRSSYAYRHLRAEEWAWALDFVRHGGRSLAAYPDYRRVVPDEAGVWRVPDAGLARRHRMSIGTIVSDASMAVRYWSGRGGGARLGSVEESFIARLKRGDCFLFAGRTLELVRVNEMTAYVKRTTGKRASVPRWNGGRMPLSSELAAAVVQQFAQTEVGYFTSPELRHLRPMLALQATWSKLPGPGHILAETWRSREGTHLFLYPFAGRHAHLGLASLMAWRIARTRPATFSLAVNDYGLTLLTPELLDWPTLLGPKLFDATHMLDDVLASLNAGELAQRRFREIARVSGLVFPAYPGAHKGARQLQASSGLFFEVLRQHDPENLLLAQAEREVLEQELESGRLREALAYVRTTPLQVVNLARPTPLAFPLLVERFREKLSTEKLADRVARMLRDLERAADAGPGPRRSRSRAKAD